MDERNLHLLTPPSWIKPRSHPKGHDPVDQRILQVFLTVRCGPHDPNNIEPGVMGVDPGNWEFEQTARNPGSANANVTFRTL